MCLLVIAELIYLAVQLVFEKKPEETFKQDIVEHETQPNCPTTEKPTVACAINVNERTYPDNRHESDVKACTNTCKHLECV
ncbi:hypothetical protein V5799_031086 [Amblyomma americanum]|uniref:Secreted protein n=1 Tax=Amblyomma americanum TaxID=6943 RepID=A0AAQ4ELB2_AMBAM